jgi:predicted ribosome quality control (RQC) complex YloA/Tae2 family protein
MTYNSERLDRIEAILDKLAECQEQHEREMAERQKRSDREIAAIQAIIESNARAIEANSDAMAEMRRDMQDTTAAASQLEPPSELAQPIFYKRHPAIELTERKLRGQSIYGRQTAAAIALELRTVKPITRWLSVSHPGSYLATPRV